VKALDTNVVVRLLVNDDEEQGRRARSLLEDAEERGERFFLTRVALLETIWVLGAVYELDRSEVLAGVEALARLSCLELEDHAAALELVRLGKTTSLHLPDLVIGLAGRSRGCEATLTFDRGLRKSELFEQL
jgi:predicted nucleic-acid-binding protein